MGNLTSHMTPQEQLQMLQRANFSERDIKKLYKRFTELDTNFDGQLDIHEFFQVPDVADNPLVQRVISIFDVDSDGKISFEELLFGLARLSTTANNIHKTKFAFDVFDINKDGTISNGELFEVMKMMVGKNLNDMQLQQLVDRTIVQADSDGDGKISFAEFSEMVSHIDIANKLRISL